MGYFKIVFEEDWFKVNDIIDCLQPQNSIVFYRRVLWGLFWFRVREWMYRWVRVHFMVESDPMRVIGGGWEYEVTLSDKRYKLKT